MSLFYIYLTSSTKLTDDKYIARVLKYYSIWGIISFFPYFYRQTAPNGLPRIWNSRRSNTIGAPETGNCLRRGTMTTLAAKSSDRISLTGTREMSRTHRRASMSSRESPRDDCRASIRRREVRRTNCRPSISSREFRKCLRRASMRESP